MKILGRVELQLHAFLTSAVLGGGGGSSSSSSSGSTNSTSSSSSSIGTDSGNNNAVQPVGYVFNVWPLSNK
jgi:hypothetical protein